MGPQLHLSVFKESLFLVFCLFQLQPNLPVLGLILRRLCWNKVKEPTLAIDTQSVRPSDWLNSFSLSLWIPLTPDHSISSWQWFVVPWHIVISSFLVGYQKDENVFFLLLERWFKSHWISCGIFSSRFATINFSHKCTCNQMWKNNELTNEIVGFNGLIVFL